MQTSEHIPLYFDWQFWTAVVAILALILSQLPPVRLLVKRSQLDMELYSWVHLTHKVGNPNVQLHIILRNVGGRTIRIKGATIALKRDGNNLKVMPAQNYLQNPNDKTNVLFTTFSLKPEEEWSHIVNFLNYFSRDDNKKYKNAESDLRADIVKKLEIKNLKNKVLSYLLGKLKLPQLRLNLLGFKYPQC